MGTYSVVMEISFLEIPSDFQQVITKDRWKVLPDPRDGHKWYIYHKSFGIRREAEELTSKKLAEYRKICTKIGVRNPYIGTCKVGDERDFLSPLPEFKLSPGVVSVQEFIKAKAHAKKLVDQSWYTDAIELYKELRSKLIQHKCAVSEPQYQIAYIEYRLGYTLACHRQLKEAQETLHQAQDSLSQADWDESVRDLKIEILGVLVQVSEMLGDKAQSQKLDEIRVNLILKGAKY